ncbi:MAG: SGNH/GDSL hydrolase family protein [Mizugakiibacter sp.]|uniref:SGNH/GDSL hydrolase family protein n=1 Tax=Mizugakiibacter sp. TaxID=1972610 RepID=UPI0031C9F557|nr:SGNH/GDSL hydrolase family protein [Xanthomonadaceae bacterium]
MPSAPPRFLALGDSYTIGEGVAPSGRWPAQLAARLRAEGIAVADPRIVAVTGWTTDELAAAMDAATFAPPYALVTLLIGVNNQYRGRGLDDYRGEFRALLERALALAGGEPRRTVVVSIPDWGMTPFARAQGRDAAAVAAAIDAFNAVNREEAEARGARWVDVTDLSRERGDAPDMLAEDGLHPSAAQYARWTQRILPAARAALARPR